MAYPEKLDICLKQLRNAKTGEQAASLLTFLEYEDGKIIAKAIKKDPSLIANLIPEFALGVGYDQHNPNHELTLIEHELLTMSLLPPVPILRLAGLIHDIGKPLTVSIGDDGNCHYHGHMEIGAEICERAGKEIGMDLQDLELLVFLVKNHDRRPRPGIENAKRFIKICGTRERMNLLLMLMTADTNAHSEKGAIRLSTIMNESITDVNEVAERFFTSI